LTHSNIKEIQLVAVESHSRTFRHFHCLRNAFDVRSNGSERCALVRRPKLSEITEQVSPAPAEPARRGPLLTLEEARILKAWLHASTTPPTVAARARIIRFAAAGLSNSEIAREVGVSRGTVILWRDRFECEGLLSLTEVRPGRGRRPTVSIRAAREILGVARARRRRGGAAQSYGAQAAACGVSTATVYRVWDAHGLPRRTPVDAVADGTVPEILGIYLDPPDRVLAVAGPPAEGELAVIPGALARALDRFDRVVSGPSSARDRERAFLKFLRRVERSARSGVMLRLVVATANGVHERPVVARWIRAHRFHVEHAIGDDAIGDELTRRLLEHTGELAWKRCQRGGVAGRLAEDLRGFLSSYDGDPDRFVWLASESG
jgi:transposase